MCLKPGNILNGMKVLAITIMIGVISIVGTSTCIAVLTESDFRYNRRVQLGYIDFDRATFADPPRAIGSPRGRATEKAMSA